MDARTAPLFFHQSPGDPSKRLVRTEFVRLVPFVHGLDLPTLADDRPLFGSLESLTRHPRNNPGHPRLILVYPVHEREQRPLLRRPPEKPKDDEAFVKWLRRSWQIKGFVHRLVNENKKKGVAMFGGFLKACHSWSCFRVRCRNQGGEEGVVVVVVLKEQLLDTCPEMPAHAGRCLVGPPWIDHLARQTK